MNSASWMRIELFSLIVSLLFWALTGCNSVRPAQLTGTWTMKNASRQVLSPELRNASARIVLNPNGTFVASDLPGLFYFPGRRPAQLESGSGTWSLVSREGKQQVQLDFRTITDWKDALPYGTQLDFSNGSLFYFLGDPDEGRKVSFERK